MRSVPAHGAPPIRLGVGPISLSGELVSSATIGRWLLLLVGLQLASATTFIQTVGHPVFDDATALSDVERYGGEGLSLSAVAHHESAAGPFGYWWMAAIGEALGGGLAAYRTAASLSFLGLCGLLLGASRHLQTRGVWLLVAVVTLSNIYVPTASATLLTESLALCLVLAASALWSLPRRRAVAAVVAGLLAGLACVTRQYYVAFIPGLAAAWAVQGFADRRDTLARTMGLVLAIAPIALLTILWGGVTSPALRSGVATPEHVFALSLSPLRPLVCALLLGLETLPFLLGPRAAKPRVSSLMLAALAAVTLAAVAPDLWRYSNPARDTGPIDRIVDLAAGWGWLIGVAASATFAWLGMIGWLNVGSAAREKLQMLRRDPLAVLGAVTVCAYVAGQLVVGGTEPYYQRYDLQMVPFLAMIAAPLFGTRLTHLQLGWFTCTALVGQLMLWRHAW